MKLDIKSTLDTSMLIAQMYFQMEHMLAMALKAKASRFNHACMDRANRDFVNLGAFHSKVFRNTRQDFLSDSAIPGIVARSIRRMVS